MKTESEELEMRANLNLVGDRIRQLGKKLDQGVEDTTRLRPKTALAVAFIAGMVVAGASAAAIANSRKAKKQAE